MLNLEEIMILCNKKDKTSDIQEYIFDITLGKVTVFYKGNPKPYEYNNANFSILEPQPYNFEDKCISYDGNALTNLKKIVLFTNSQYQFLRVFKKGKPAFSASKDSFTITESTKLPPDGQKIFNYLQTIANLTTSNQSDISDSSDENNKSFLAKIYDKLNFIHPESVLATYLNHHPISKQETQLEELIFPFHFNLSQKAALEKALTHSVSIIEGPPGTGKTQTILNILANLTSGLNKTVGVVSFNNEAVKNVKEKLDKQQYGFLVADLGRKEKRKAFFENLPSIDIAQWEHQENLTDLQNQIKELNQTLNQLLIANNRQAQIIQEIAAYQLEQRHFEQYYATQQLEDIKKLPFYTQSSKKIAEYLADMMFEEKLQSHLKFLHTLKLLFKYRKFPWNKLKENEINVILNLQKKFYELKIKELNEECHTLSAKLEKHSFKSLQEEHQCISEKIFQKKLFLSHAGLEQPKFSCTEYQKKYPEFIKYFPITLSTNHSIRDSIPPDCLLDYIIIDEASQVDLLTGVLALSCCKNLIIVGDMKQLPQIVDKKNESKFKEWNISQEYDYFKQSILSSFLHLYQEEIPRTILKEHYRCHPQIIQFCNQKYYNGELIPFTNEECCQVPLVLYKTSKGNHMRTITHGDSKESYNQRELDVIQKEVLLNVDLVSKDIGIATPYRKQADKASALFADEIESDTIHKYQGREKEVIIMSTVLDNSGSAQRGFNFVDDPCLINVAVSRAKKQFILVTNDELFQNKGQHVHDLLRYIQYNTLDEHVIESQVVSVFDLLYKNYSKKLESLKSKMLYHSQFESENIMHTTLTEILSEPQFEQYSIANQVLLRNIIKNINLLEEHEISFINNRASVDFVIYNKQDKQCALIIEVDGFKFHENNPEQLKRDAIKNDILHKYNIPFLRLPTNGSGEKEKIQQKLNEIDSSYNLKENFPN